MATEAQLTDIQKFKKILEYFVAHMSYLQWRESHLNGIPEYCDAKTKIKEIKEKAKKEGKKAKDDPDWTSQNKIVEHYSSSFPKPEPKDNVLGWDVVENNVINRNMVKTGNGYNGEKIQNQINDCDKYYIDGIDCEQQICMSAQTGFQLQHSSYLHWHDESCSHGNININPIWDKNDYNIKSLLVGQGKGSSYDLQDTASYAITSLDLFNGKDPNQNIINLFTLFKDFRKREYYGNFLSGTCQDILNKNYNLILSGAPGTGKTWLAYDIASHLCHGKAYSELDETEKKQIGFVQFHPSYDYTDFVEGLRPDPDTTTDGNVGFARTDGVFKEFCKRAISRQLLEGVIRNEYHYAESTLNSFSITVLYSIARNLKLKPFVFIIDEINRGELSKIFGELFFCIDKGYRGDKHKVLTQYQNLVDADDVFANGFYIPENVYIIGTMNDIDRSVETMDFAMRRRFTFKEILASDRLAMLDDALEDDVKEVAIKTLSVLNKQIEKTLKLSSAYHVGPAYFLDLKKERYDGDFDMLWSYNIKPLLQEYMRGKNGAAEMIEKVHEEYTKASRSDVED